MLYYIWCVTVIVVGYAISLFGGSLVIGAVLNYLLKRHFPNEQRSNALSSLVGIMERFLYTSAYLLGAQEFVAVWLAVKFVGEWNQIKKESETLYQLFLIGNGLSVIVGIGVAVIIQFLLRLQ